MPSRCKRVERKSPTLGAKPPEGAIILFDGNSADEWGGGKIVEEDLLFRGINSKKTFGRQAAHRVSHAVPAEGRRPGPRQQRRLHQRLSRCRCSTVSASTGANNECGAFYSMAKPDVNMCLPPLVLADLRHRHQGRRQGQTVATVLHNGVKVHDNFVLKTATPKPQIINLQNHGNPVVYRNIWLVEAK